MDNNMQEHTVVRPLYLNLVFEFRKQIVSRQVADP